MNYFTASNGMTIRSTSDGHIQVEESTRTAWMVPVATSEALREFFRAEEDARLGVWRSQDDPTWTARRQGDIVYFVNSDHQRAFHIALVNEAWKHQWSDDLRAIAREYISAHPEPKPWHDAKHGEGWVLTIDGAERVAVRGPVEDFIHEKGVTPWSSTTITAGRRIYPEPTV